MPIFHYEAIDESGKTQKGSLNADSIRAVRAILRTQTWTPVHVEEITSAGTKDRPHRFGQSFSTTELALFTRQLASLLEASLPLEQALTILQEQAERTYVRDVIASVRTQVTGGTSFSDALSQYPNNFSEIYRALVGSGEQIGQLAHVLLRLADYIEQRNALTQKIKLAFTYPAIVTVVAFVIVIFLLTYVVPQIVSVFAHSKQALPFLTIAMLAISNGVRQYGVWIGLALTGLGFVGHKLLQRPQYRHRWHVWLLTAPLYGKLEKSMNTARFASTLAIMIGAGVPILRALHISQNTLSNVAMRAHVEQATTQVREGASLTRALSSSHYFPPMLIYMIRAGETTGGLSAMLERAARAQEQDLERRALTMAGLLEPALILSMGVIVLLIVLAVLMPIIEINQLVR